MRDKAIDRVRKLLAKADSTTFPAEAAALRAKATELVARHGLAPDEITPPPPPDQPPRVWAPDAPVNFQVVIVVQWAGYSPWLAYNGTGNTTAGTMTGNVCW